MDRRGISRAVIAVAGAVAMLGVVASAAEIVGVERSNLYRRMRACGIGPVRKMEGEDRSA